MFQPPVCVVQSGKCQTKPSPTATNPKRTPCLDGAVTIYLGYRRARSLRQARKKQYCYTDYIPGCAYGKKNTSDSYEVLRAVPRSCVDVAGPRG